MADNTRMTPMNTPIKLIIGLGNPGPEYADTRHNAGAWLIKTLATQAGKSLRKETKFHGLYTKAILDSHDCHLLTPTTYMNRSGQAVSALMKFYKLKPDQIAVAHDELDLPAGTCKLKIGGGHGGHNGLRDIFKAIGTQEFLRIRLGIGHPGHRDDVVDYVLKRPSKSDKECIETNITELQNTMPAILTGDLERAMLALHTK